MNGYGAVYIFENSKAQRVKIGSTSNLVADRLSRVNDMWLERKATCQICGGHREVNIKGFIPKHVVSGIICPGGNALPFEKDVRLAESYLENMKNRLNELSGVQKNSATRIVNNLKKRIVKFRHYNGPLGEWQSRIVFYTKCAGQVELRSHRILDEYLDKKAPFGEVFCCPVSVATDAVETVLSQLGLLHSAKKLFGLPKYFPEKMDTIIMICETCGEESLVNIPESEETENKHRCPKCYKGLLRKKNPETNNR